MTPLSMVDPQAGQCPAVRQERAGVWRRRLVEFSAIVLVATILVMTPSVTGLGRAGNLAATPQPSVLDRIAADAVRQERTRP